MPRHVAILYNHEPSGHSHAARAIEEALHLEDPALKVSRLDLSSGIHPWVGPMVAKAYYKLIQSAPGLWDHLYDNRGVSGAAAPLLERLRRMEAQRIRPFLASRRPDAVVATQALPCNVLAYERRSGALAAPLVGVLTDHAAHHYWVAEGVDAYCVPSEDAAVALADQGVQRARVHVTGVPLAQAFTRLPAKEAARRRLGVPLGRPAVLVAGGTHGLGRMEEAVRALERVSLRPSILAVCGENSELSAKLRRRKRSDVIVFDGIDRRVPELMAAADLFVGKPGGLSSSEALAAGLPLLIYSPIPGQEEANARFLTALGAAERARDANHLALTAGRLLADPALLARMAEAARRAGRPDAAARVASTVLKVLAAGPDLVR